MLANTGADYGSLGGIQEDVAKNANGMIPQLGASPCDSQLIILLLQRNYSITASKLEGKSLLM